MYFSRDVLIAGKLVKKGTYAFFTIPGREHWIAIFNTRSDQHLADDYNEKEDVIPVTLRPEHFEASVQRLTYSVSATTDTSGFVRLQWEKMLIRVPINVPSQ